MSYGISLYTDRIYLCILRDAFRILLTVLLVLKDVHNNGGFLPYSIKNMAHGLNNMDGNLFSNQFRELNGARVIMGTLAC